MSDVLLRTTTLHMVGIRLMSGLGTASVAASRCDAMTLTRIPLVSAAVKSEHLHHIADYLLMCQ